MLRSGFFIAVNGGIYVDLCADALAVHTCQCRERDGLAVCCRALHEGKGFFLVFFNSVAVQVEMGKGVQGRGVVLFGGFFKVFDSLFHVGRYFFVAAFVYLSE